MVKPVTVPSQFGFVALFSYGAPFFLTGVAMLAVGRWRSNRAVFWAVLGAVWLFVLGYILVAPLSCRSSATGAGISGGADGSLRLPQTTCSNLIGIHYGGFTP